MAPIENRRAESAALTDETEVAGTSHGSGKGRIEAVVRAHDAEAVGSDDPPTARRVSCSRMAPLSPVSLNPADMMMAPDARGGAFPDDSWTVRAGVTITARSIFPGASLMRGKQGRSKTLDRFGLIG